MKKPTLVTAEAPTVGEFRSELDELVRAGAQRMLQQALELEVADYIDRHQEHVDENGHRVVVRNGKLPQRKILTGAGPLEIKQPRINDKRDGQQFTSAILPRYMRRSPSLEALIPALYLKGVSSGQFQEALEAILGPDVPGLSANVVVGLKKQWEDDYDQWNKRSLAGKHYVYVWADGIHFNVRLEPDRTCLLVLIGALPNGRKELIAVADGFRESTISWQDVLRDLKNRGLTEAPRLAIGDGALGFWAALSEVFPETREQRCWVHKTANILDKMPKSVQAQAKNRIHDIYLAGTRKAALAAYDEFIKLYGVKWEKACDCLVKDKDVLFAFYDFPAEQWKHIRSTNPIESTFGTVRHRTRRTKGCGTRKATLSMVYKLGIEAEGHWRRLNGSKLIVKLIEGATFIDGELAA